MLAMFTRGRLGLSPRSKLEIWVALIWYCPEILTLPGEKMPAASPTWVTWAESMERRFRSAVLAWLRTLMEAARAMRMLPVVEMGSVLLPISKVERPQMGVRGVDCPPPAPPP